MSDQAIERTPFDVIGDWLPDVPDHWDWERDGGGLGNPYAALDTLATELKRLREAHRHCWHDNANYLCEGDTCGDALENEEVVANRPSRP